MKPFLLVVGGALMISRVAFGAEGDLEQLVELQQNASAGTRLQAARELKLDPKRIVNESNSFMKEREPEMNAEEYALYDKVVAMLTKNPEFALRLLEGMKSDKEPPSPAFEFILGNAHYAAGENDQAEASYRRAIDRYPTFLRAWNNLGVLYYSANRFADAVGCFSKSVALGDRDPTTFGLLGYSLEQQGNVVSAEMAYMQALGGDPTNIDWKEGLLRICMTGRQYGRAESLVRNLIDEAPTEPRFWLVYANILLSENRKTEAMALLEVCARTKVAGAEELVLLGDLYAEQDLAQEAVAAYQRVRATAPEVAEPKLLRYAQVLIAAGKLNEAGQLLAGIKPEPTGASRIGFLQTKADLCAAEKRWPEARQQVEELLKLAPLNGRGLLTLGQTYAAEDDLGRAAFAFEAAYRIETTRYRASLELANIELRNRHYDKSVDYLQKALSIQKTDEVEDYLARIKTLVAKDG